MIKNLTCIECPKSCDLQITIQGDHVFKVEGNLCPKGKVYAQQEIEDPRRILTATVVARGLSIKMVPVRINHPIPKSKIFEAMSEIRAIRVNKPCRSGDILLENLLGLGVNVVSTREVPE